MRTILNNALRARWWTDEARIRPIPLPNTRFPYIGLLADPVSASQIYHPRLPFNEAKVFYDKKNGYYALKKEVAVTAHAPHFAVFSAHSAVGSKHDYAILKDGFKDYLLYLQKKPNEVLLFLII